MLAADPVKIYVLGFLACAGCSAYYADSGHAAAAGALADLTSPAADAKYAEAAAGATKAAAAVARAELLGPETTAAAAALVKTTGDSLRLEVAGVVQTAGAGLMRIDLRPTVRLVLDESFGDKTLREIDALRERLVGAPLRDDLNDAIDGAGPHLATVAAQALATATKPVQVAADAEAEKWKPIAVGFAVGCGLLLACLFFAGWLVREHQKTIRSLAARPPP